jgi:hypothetical protein
MVGRHRCSTPSVWPNGYVIAAAALLFMSLIPAHSAPTESKGKPPKLAPLSRTGQTTSYAPGDDGDLQSGVASPSPRFTVNGDGTATDRLTGLTWTTDGTQYIIGWVNALNMCNSYSVGTLDDWRLPNFKELLSLLDFENRDPMLPSGHPFNVAMYLGGYRYWSSTTNPVYDSGNDVYTVSMDYGEIRIWPKGGDGYVLCVRGGG